MQRRRFLRLTSGSGVLAATAAAVGGCTAHMPAEAIAPWQGPGEEADVRRWMLGYAILAPNSHNLQPWLVDLSTPDEIVLHCDLQRLLPQTDPFARQTLMSHGTFLELLDIAARERGLHAQIELFPQGVFGPAVPDSRPVARIRLAADAGVARDPLFSQILRRRTHRGPYELSRGVPAAAWQAMAGSMAGAPLHFGHVDAAQPDVLQRHRDIAARAWQTELTTPQAMMESYKVLRVGADEVAQHRDGLVLLEPLPVLLSRLGLFDRSRPPAPDDFAVRRQVRDFQERLDSTPGFLWMVSDGNDRAAQVAAGRAYMRVQLAATAAGLFLQPIQQALQEYPQQAEARADIHRLVGAARPGQTVQMWARVGHAQPVEPAPRRGVPAQLLRA